MSGIRKNALALMTAVCTTLFLASTPAWAQDSAKPDPNPGALTITGSIDFLNQYMFRGIQQNNTGFATWPAFDLGLAAYSGDGGLKSVNINFGTWNSLHTGNTGQDGPSGKLWYESDFYTKLGWTFLEDFSSAITYTAYMSPNDSFGTVQELAFSLGYNDSKLLGPFALNPSMLVAFEIKGQADAGRHRGVYLQAGITPGYTFNAKGTYPVTLTVPLLVGLSLSEYYEFGTGDDDTFGFFQGGVGVAVPLAFIPASFGSWTIKGSLNVLHLGDNLKAVNNNDRTEVIGTIASSNFGPPRSIMLGGPDPLIITSW